MYRLRHPFSGQIYGALGNGLVEVEKDGRRGVFDRYGYWVRGDIRSADAEMCRWLGTHEQAIPSRHSEGFQSDDRESTPADDDSPVPEETE